MSLSFSTLRQANAARLPLFRNQHGALAHSAEDGSDWTPAQWLQAMVGELGEFASERLRYEAGQLGAGECAELAAKEQADVVIYADILARRSLDVLEPCDGAPDASQQLMHAIACIGMYANARKKFERGDISHAEMVRMRGLCIGPAICVLADMMAGRSGPQRKVAIPGAGVDLGEAVRQKFNEVSERVQAPIWIDDDRVMSRLIVQEAA
jgi:NTP pyrophosphatase (non-canonical NTP hydrolase)